MSRIRQRLADASQPLIRTLSLTVPGGHTISEHAHPWAQLIYTSSGTLAVEADRRRWVVPAQRGVWMPPDTVHTVTAVGECAIRTLYLSPGIVAGLPELVSVLEISALLHELILHASSLGMLRAGDADHEHLAHVIRARLVAMPETELGLREPIDPRARAIADTLRQRPGDTTPLARLARGCGASPRTLERAFLRETGLTFGAWRTELRLQHAITRLEAGRTVAETATDCGYRSVSAFVAAFRRSLGVPPGAYRRGLSPDR
ncbi:MAG: helix-turn-helix domain-containing protein [Phycisphaerales bacterium JB040]